MLLECFTQYASKFGKLSGGHRTGKGQFSFQSQRRAMSKNVQTTTQLNSFHMLARLYSKFFKLGFNSLWTKNFQMYKLDLEKVEEPEIKLPTSTGSAKKQENSRKTFTSAPLTTVMPLTVRITTNCEKFLKRWDYQMTLPVCWEICMQVKKQHLDLDIEQWTNQERSKSRLYTVTVHVFYAEYSIRNARLGESQVQIKIAGGNINKLRYADDTTLMAESDRKWRIFWWR